ncbi:TetR/AcrR family transcriptional regulator [Streptomyces sp. NPDC093228]|uniref:TetR/AcrR family transcriptional regulator n=1 Tax=Streptomyces sp. NPDC093228 TaxID=3155070 RepID=UPI003444E3E9
MSEAKPAGKASARERLLSAANKLFYAEGVHTVGIDRIVEHAGVAKATLYNLFGGKEQLILAYLESRHNDTLEEIHHAVERHRTPRERLLAVFDAQGESFAEPDFNGCAFVTASAEAPRGGLIERTADQYRISLLGILTQLSAELGAAEPAALAHQLQLLYDGAALAARMDRSARVAKSALSAATLLVDAAAPAAGFLPAA